MVTISDVIAVNLLEHWLHMQIRPCARQAHQTPFAYYFELRVENLVMPSHSIFRL